jgi:pimeloyl-ACP methyl ester carboxylesterase
MANVVMADVLRGAALRDHYVLAHGVRLHVVSASDSNPPVVLLHGFPEPWLGWQHQLPALVESGLAVFAPDQRGYNLSDKPRAVSAYALDLLATDVASMLDSLGLARAAIVGHDWGALVAWRLALTRPERVSRLVIINVPHPDVFRYRLRHDPRQMLRSWYGAFFQLPWLPEALSRRNEFRLWKRALTATSRAGTFSPRDLELYAQAWSQAGAFPAMLNWYRAFVRFPPRPTASPRVRVPTLVIWGKRDPALLAEMARASVDQCDDGRLEMLEEATHWVHHEEPARVNQLILEFLQQR